MLVVTGAAGFIGSCLITGLNQQGFSNVIAVDEFGREDKLRNLNSKRLAGVVHRNYFITWLQENHEKVHYLFHLGARTDTTEMKTEVFDQLNLQYSKALWTVCAEKRIPMTYASSAATYGDGSQGYADDHDLINQLKPLNPYGISKNDFDLWAIQQQETPPHWVGLKFFNVYGPNENHKGRMASVVYHAFHQIRKTGRMKLFKSHKQGIADGQQMRDFIYVKDIVDILLFCLQARPVNGIYNAGTGQARAFFDLVNNTFTAMDLPSAIEFIETPLDIRDNYQYFTQAPMKKLQSQGYQRTFTTLEAGVSDYVRSYLRPAVQY